MTNLLIDLVEYLKKVDPTKFNLRKWLIVDGEAIITGGPLGYACLVDSWKTEGMKMGRGYECFEPNFKSEAGGFAVALFLGKPYEWVRSVFYPDSYGNHTGTAALEAVIARLKEVIDGA